MKPEEKARAVIDSLLEAAGWKIQDLDELNLGAAQGIAVREFPLTTGATDYLLFVDRKAVGVVEAKPEGNTLSGVADQTSKYVAGIPESLPAVIRRVGVEETLSQDKANRNPPNTNRNHTGGSRYPVNLPRLSS